MKTFDRWIRFWASLKIGIRRLFAFGQIPIGKIFGGYLQVATLKSSCIVLFAHMLKIHPIKLLEIPFYYFRSRERKEKYIKFSVFGLDFFMNVM